MPKAQRLENKKRKIQAFLEIAQLNDAEGRKRSSMQVAPVKKPKLEKDSHGEEDIKDSDQSFSTNCESLDELRERLRERKKKFQLRPHFDLKTKGHDASLDLPQNMRTPLFMKDLQGLLLYAMLGSEAPVEPSRWCKFQQWSKLSHIQCLIVDGLGLTDFAQCEELKSICDFKLEFVSPSSYGSNVADDLSILPLSSKRQKELIQAYRSIEKACSQGQAFKVFRSMFKVKESSEKSTEVREESLKMKLMLSLTQLLEEKYPLPIKPCLQTLYKDFKFSQEEYKQVDEKSPLYAIDCEMCLTTSGQLELTKICVIDSNLQEVYQSFVKPRNKIVNYLTRFSGVTATSLENVTTCLEDVQEELKRILPPDAIWIGQSLNCDLNALKLFHPYVIDTSVIYNISGESGRKTSLKTLAHMFLGEEIQDKQGEGHDPKEDAMAAMKLVLLKLEKGYNFGDAIRDNVSLSSGAPNDGKSQVISTSLFNEAKEKEKKICVIGTSSVMPNYKKYWNYEDNKSDNVTLKECPSIKETIASGCRLGFEQDLTICHVNANEVSEEKRLKKVVKWSQKLESHTSINGLFLTVWSGSEEQAAFVGIKLNKEQIT